MNKKSKLILIIAVIAISVLGVYRISESVKPPKPAVKETINVKTTTAEIETLYVASPVMGRIDPVESATIVPMMAGKVTAVHVGLGDYVKKGDLLFEIDKGQAQTSYNQAELAYESAKSDLNRMSLLYGEGAVSKQQYQGAKTQFDLAKQSLNASALALSYCNSSSPIDGYVTLVNVSAGSLASQSMPAIAIADTSDLKINTSVSDNLIGKITQGDKVDIIVSAVSDVPFTGTVKAISPAPALDTLTYPVTISVEKPYDTVKAGMFAQIMIVSDRKENVLCIPSDAVFMKSGVSKVARLNGNIPTLVTVTTGLDNGTMVEITSGLSPGDTIITSSQQFITEGEAVNIIEE